MDWPQVLASIGAVVCLIGAHLIALSEEGDFEDDL